VLPELLYLKKKIFQAVSDDMLVELKACFMEAYDDNQDGKIDIREVGKQQNGLVVSHIVGLLRCKPGQ